MVGFKTDELKQEFHEPRRFDWRLKIFLMLLGMIFHFKFQKILIVTCLGRDYNPVSAHYNKDKICCAADIRSRDLSIEELTWLKNLDSMLNPYMDIVIEDERYTGKIPPGGNHIHVELNPNYWTKLTGMI